MGTKPCSGRQPLPASRIARPIPTLLALGALLLVAPMSLRAQTPQLFRIQYRLHGREVSSIGTVSYEKNERISLRLFDEQIADYYSLHLDYESLVEVVPISRDEAARITVERNRLRSEKLAAREQARKEREARREKERARAEAERAEARGGRRSSRGRRPPAIDAPSRREDPGAGQVVRMSPGSAADMLAELDDALQPIPTRLASARGGVAALEDAIQAIFERPKTPRRARRIHSEIGALGTTLDKISRSLKLRQKAVERLRGDVNAGLLDPEDTRTRVDHYLRSIGGLEGRLAKVETGIQRQRARIDEIPPPVEEVAESPPVAQPPGRVRVVPATAPGDTGRVAAAREVEADAIDAPGSEGEPGDVAVVPRASRDEPPPPEASVGRSVDFGTVFVVLVCTVLCGLLVLAAWAQRRDQQPPNPVGDTAGQSAG